MNIAFVSNYLSPHQAPLSKELFDLTGGDYRFIATENEDLSRLDSRWGLEAPGYLVDANREPESCKSLVDRADVVIAGSAPESLVAKRVREGKLVFRYSERLLKNGSEPLKDLPRRVRFLHRNPRGSKTYLLAAGAFAAADYGRFGLFEDRAYRWGYFPETGLQRSAGLGEHGGTEIIWCGRFVPWKHPEAAIELSDALARAGKNFHVSLVGAGPLEGELNREIARCGLEEHVSIEGPVPPERVRERMSESDIFLFTSGREEGWGAVLNEAMGAGCAVVASDAAGATPYLVHDGENGRVCHSGDQVALESIVLQLLDSEKERTALGRAARKTIASIWNAETAARRLVKLSEAILSGEESPKLYEDGPCSPAPIIRDDWFRQ